MSLLRKDLNKKLFHLLQHHLSIICAPDGYGKSQCVKHFLESEKVDYIWIQVNEGNDQEIMQQLANQFSISLDNASSMQLVMDRISEKLNQDFYVVLNDFNDEQYQSLVTFCLALKEQTSSQLHVILLMQQINDFNLLRLFEEKSCFTLSIQDFKLNATDIAQIFKKHGIKLTNEEVDQLYEFSEGWTPAIEMALRSMQNGSSIFSTSELKALLQRGNFAYINDEVMEGLMRLSILSHFTLEQALYLCQSKEVVKAISDLESNHILVRKIDFENFTFSKLLRQHLKQALLLSDLNYDEVYTSAGEWFETKDHVVDAIAMYLEGNNFNQIIRIMKRLEYSLLDIAPELIIQVFKRMPDEYKYANPYIYLMHICDMVTNVDVFSGMKLLEAFRTDLELGKYGKDTKHLLGEYFFIRAFSQYNDVSLMMKDFHLAYDALQGKQSRFAYPQMISTFGAFHLLYLYHHSEGQLAQLVETIQDEVKYFIQISNGVNSGSEFQTRAELDYETGNYENVFELANLSYQEAMRNQQLGICVCSLLLQGRLAFVQKNVSVFNEVKQKLNAFYEQTNIPILHCQIDCALAYLHILNNERDEVVAWIKEEDIASTAILHEAWGISYIVLILYHIQQANYKKVLLSCDILENYYKQQMHLFGMYYVLLGRVIAYYYTRKREKAMCELKRLLLLSEKDNISTIFIEMYEYLYDIFLVFKPVTTYEKKIMSLLKEYRKEQMKDKLIEQLTPKEREVIMLFIDSKTSKEVAEILMVSENTVRTHLKSIYSKLNISKKSELIEKFDRRL